MDRGGEWSLAVLTVLGFAGFLYTGFKRWNFHAYIMGTKEVPIRLPLFSFFWTASTALLFFGWREVQGAAPPEPSHPYFRVGWGPTLVLFNVCIDTWWKYSIIQCYQVARAVLNSLLTQVYLPWLSSTLRAAVRPDSRRLSNAERALTLAGQAATTTAAWWSTVTNILASVSQIDLALVTLLAGVVCDFELCRALLQARREAFLAYDAAAEKAKEKPKAPPPDKPFQL